MKAYIVEVGLRNVGACLAVDEIRSGLWLENLKRGVKQRGTYTSIIFAPTSILKAMKRTCSARSGGSAGMGELASFETAFFFCRKPSFPEP